MIEPLENRIAPAAILTFFEADGDKITVKTTKGNNADLATACGINKGDTGITNITVNFLINPTVAAEFANTNITITAAGGTGATKNLANFVRINGFDSGGAGNIDFGSVKVKGHLVYIDAGDNDLTTNAIKKLDVTDWGPGSGTTSATSSQIRGNIGSIKVRQDFNGFIVSNNAAGTANFQDADATVIGSFTVGDDIAQLNGDDVGHLQVHRISKLVVKDSFFGTTNSSLRNGLIEADSVGLIAIHNMAVNASIVLS
jgi:hypothetical protein